MTITATEFKTNFGKYLNLVQEEDIFITKNGKEIGRFTSTKNDKLSTLYSMVGVVSEKDIPTDYKSARLARQ